MKAGAAQQEERVLIGPGFRTLEANRVPAPDVYSSYLPPVTQQRQPPSERDSAQRRRRGLSRWAVESDARKPEGGQRVCRRVAGAQAAPPEWMAQATGGFGGPICCCSMLRHCPDDQTPSLSILAVDPGPPPTRMAPKFRILGGSAWSRNRPVCFDAIAGIHSRTFLAIAGNVVGGWRQRECCVVDCAPAPPQAPPQEE